MTNQEVENFCKGINSFYMGNTYEQFCAKCGFREDYYSEQKWEEFKQLSMALTKFDNEIMTTLVRSGLGLPNIYIPA